MTCGYCGFEFDLEESRHACAACELVGAGCKLVKCPRCGYDMPEEPVFIQRFRAWRERRREARAEQAAPKAASGEGR